MQNFSEFIQKVEARLAADEQQQKADQRELTRQHEVKTRRMAGFTEKADRIIETIIRPHMEKIVSYFDNASIPLSECNGGHCVARFETRPRFPASTTLDFSVSHDADVENINVFYTLQILPIFVKFDKQDTISFPLTDVDESRLTDWVETKLLTFLDTYLQLEHIEQYQKQNLALDPVCGMQVNKAFAIAEAVNGSQKYYFCTEDCRAKFTSEPERYK